MRGTARQTGAVAGEGTGVASGCHRVAQVTGAVKHTERYFTILVTCFCVLNELLCQSSCELCGHACIQIMDGTMYHGNICVLA